MSLRRGRIDEFDERRGIGAVVLDDGARLFFHCTAIADGSRSIDEGVAVICDVRPGLVGRFEARVVVSLAF